MSSLFVIPNLIYSNNPFLIKRLHDVVEEQNHNTIRKTLINVKYWYSSMPEECKKILHAVIANNVFDIFNGTYLRISLSRRSLYDIDLPSRNSVNPHEARTYSEALEKKHLQSIECRSGAEYSLIDNKNGFVFLVTTKKVSIIDDVGNDIVVLNSNEKHALLIYGAIKGIQKIKENMKALETLRKQESLKEKILEVYNVVSNEKKA